MGTPGPQKINRYGLEFKLRAVLMSEQPGVRVKDVAESLCIHPFMLSKWRKEVRDGVLKAAFDGLRVSSHHEDTKNTKEHEEKREEEFVLDVAAIAAYWDHNR